jgi:hypothetical protein
MQHLQPAIVLAQRPLGVIALRDVTLNAEVAPNAPLLVVKTEVVPFDGDRRSVDSALVCLDVQPAAIEKLTPDLAPVGDVVLEEIFRPRAQECLAGRSILREHRVVDLGDALMLENVVERPLLVD